LSSAEPVFTAKINNFYPINVGQGGNGWNVSTTGSGTLVEQGTTGQFGGFSWLDSIIAYGGGGGYRGIPASFTTPGSGSGGSSTVDASGGATSGQGFSGGLGSSTFFSAGGGGGAGAVGENAVSASQAGAGGIGIASSITGTSVFRAAGGGGSLNTGTTGAGLGGTGGGGNGSATGNGSAGTNNTGSGGGGAYGLATLQNGGAGGSGVIILKIPNNYIATFSSGVTSSLITSVSGFNIYVVTNTNTKQETVFFS
jgi:hypothetical protein